MQKKILIKLKKNQNHLKMQKIKKKYIKKVQNNSTKFKKKIQNNSKQKIKKQKLKKN